MGQTNTFNIPYPELSDNVNVQQDIKNIAVGTDTVLTDFQDDIVTFQNTVNDNIEEFETSVNNDITEIQSDVDTAINTTIPTLINDLGLESLLSGGLTWGQLKGN